MDKPVTFMLLFVLAAVFLLVSLRIAGEEALFIYPCVMRYVPKVCYATLGTAWSERGRITKLHHKHVTQARIIEVKV
jgi:hypothetical protein